MGIERTAFFSAWDRGRVLINPTPLIGRAFFVDNTNGSNTLNEGSSWDDAFSTLNFAISKCTANAGDKIYLAPWHAETIEDTGTASGTTTDECVVDKAGISIIGMGSGENRPTFTLEGAVDAAIVVLAGATNVEIKNIIIASNLENVGAGITLSATSDGAVIEDCLLRDGAAALELVLGISVAADCDNITIRNCVFSTFPGGGCANAIIFAGGSDNSLVIGNIATGTYSAGTFLNTAAASVNLQLIGNTLNNQGAIAVDLNASTTGLSVDNYLGGTTSIAAAYTDYDAVFNFENYVSGEDNKSGILIPANA